MKKRPTAKWDSANRAHYLLKSLLQCSYLTGAVYLMLLCGTVDNAWSFNLSPEAGVVFQGPVGDDGRETYFGYSVGLRSRKEYSDNWLLVGAPRANLTPGPQTELVEPGALYTCPVGTGGRGCRQRLLDDDPGNTRIRSDYDIGYVYKEYKDHGWAGAAIDTQPGDGQSSMACAPRWSNQEHRITLLMNGACYGINSEQLLVDGQAMKKLPLTHFAHYNYKLGHKIVLHYAQGELGFSVHFPEMQDTVLLGAPGLFNWQGTVVELRGDGRQEFNTKFVPHPLFTRSIEDFDYLGYSVSSGRFVKDEVHYVAGAPRGADSMGKVLVFKMGSVEESELNILFERVGVQIGEYFGSSVAAVDVNADGLSDLIVGAPLYSQTFTPDQGAVYFFKNNGEGQLAIEGIRIEGSRTAGARFGHVVASPGDLNLDGYYDIMVGAPYEGPGAVYVYLGSVNGLQRQISQRISPEQLPNYHSRPLEGFGISISRGEDIDYNLYPDVAIGSYISGHAALLRARPVAVLEGTIATWPLRLTIFENFFTTKVCVTYKGIGVPPQQEVTMTVSLDHQRRFEAPRAVFRDTNTPVLSSNVTIHRDEERCTQYSVDLQERVTSSPEPIVIRLLYSLASPDLQPGETSRQSDKDLPPNSPSPAMEPITSPVMDPSQRSGVTSFLNIVTGCEDDGDSSCSSDLKVTAFLPDFSESNPMVIGKQSRIKIKVKVENLGEPAFSPNITLSVQRPLNLLLPSDCCAILCERLDSNIPSIVCHLENPISHDGSVSLEVEVDVEQLTVVSGPIVVNMTAFSSDLELQPLDNHLSLPLPVAASPGLPMDANPALPMAAETRLQIFGASLDNEMTFDRSSTSTFTATTNVSFTHVITILKRDPTPLDEVSLRVEIPVRDADNNTLLTIHTPKREFQGVMFSCTLIGAEWFAVVRSEAVNFSDMCRPDLPPPQDSPGRSRGDDSADAGDTAPLVTCRTLPYLQCAVVTCIIGSWPHGAASATLSYKLDLNLTTLEPLMSEQAGAVIASHATASIMTLSPDVSHATASIMTLSPDVSHGNTSASGLAETLLRPRLPGGRSARTDAAMVKN